MLYPSIHFNHVCYETPFDENDMGGLIVCKKCQFSPALPNTQKKVFLKFVALPFKKFLYLKFIALPFKMLDTAQNNACEYRLQIHCTLILVVSNTSL